MILRIFYTALLPLVMLFALPAQAQESIIDEVRFGIVSMNPAFLESSHPEDDQVGLNAEVLFTAFDWDTRGSPEPGFVHSLLTPRFHLGTDISLDDDGTSHAYSGLTWQFDLTRALFLETAFGLSLNNGKEQGARDANGKLYRARYGSNVLFHEQVSLGYRVNDMMNVLLTVSHYSHASVFDDSNRGTSNIAVKTGFQF
jgi:hypothetical protein